MLNFNWPEEWNRPFVESLEKRIESAIGSQMSRNKTLSFMHGKPSVSALQLGSVSPKIALKHIHCLTPNKISLSVAFEYNGDASITFKGVSFNLDTTISSPAGSSASAPAGGTRQKGAGNSADSDVASAEGGKPSHRRSNAANASDTNHSLPFLIPFEISLANIHLVGSVDIEITQSFVENEAYFTFSSPEDTHSTTIAASGKAKDTLKEGESSGEDKKHAKEQKKKKKKKVSSGTMPLSAMVQSLAYTAPSVASLVTNRADVKAIVADAEVVSEGKGHLSNTPSSSSRGKKMVPSASDLCLASDSGESDQHSLLPPHNTAMIQQQRRSNSRGSSARPFHQPAPLMLRSGAVVGTGTLRPHMLAALQHTLHQQQQHLGSGGGINEPLAPPPQLHGMRTATTSYTMNNSSYTHHAPPPHTYAVPPPALRGRGMRGMGVMRRPDAAEVRTGVVSNPLSRPTLGHEGANSGVLQQQQQPAARGGATVGNRAFGAAPAEFPLFGGGARSHRSTDSPTTTLVTPRGGLLRGGGGGDGGGGKDGVLPSSRHIILALWQRYRRYWGGEPVPRPVVSNVAAVVDAASPSIRSFLDAYVFKRYAYVPKRTVTEGGAAKPAIVGGTRVRILFFTDPIRHFTLQTNFTSIGVDRTLEQLVRSKALRPLTDMLLAEGISFVV